MSKVWTDDARGISSDIAVITPGANIGDDQHRLGTVFVDTLDANTIDLDSLSINYNLSVYAAGTAYALTATSAALDFGTTDPALVLDKAGTYLLQATANLQYVGATFAANRTVTLKLRRTNNTAADVANSSVVLGTNIVTTVNGTLDVVVFPPVIYVTTAITDSITIFGDVSVVPTAGALSATQASIVAIRLY